jgi:serine/threonine protein phosphatase 1
MTRTYVIADLHGRFDLLEAAFSAIYAADRSPDGKIVTLGDYIDRGPQSRQVIDHLMAAQKAGMNLVCLKGNHEDMMVETITKPLDPGWWVGNGGATTLVSYGGTVTPEHLQWAKTLPTLHFDQHRVYVHAGCAHNRPLDDQPEEYLLWYRPIAGEDFGHGDRHVIHGHTPNPNGPELYKNRTNLDTLAWRTGRLVIAVFDDDIAGGPIDFIEVGPGARSHAFIATELGSEKS